MRDEERLIVAEISLVPSKGLSMPPSDRQNLADFASFQSPPEVADGRMSGARVGAGGIGAVVLTGLRDAETLDLVFGDQRRGRSGQANHRDGARAG